MEITNGFKMLNFHDALIRAVVRKSQKLEIAIEYAVLPPEHPASGGKKVILENVRIRFHGVTSEQAVVWLDDKAPVPHPDPSRPICEVTETSQQGDHFLFEGFSSEREWAQWSIYAAGFSLIGVADC